MVSTAINPSIGVKSGNINNIYNINNIFKNDLIPDVNLPSSNKFKLTESKEEEQETVLHKKQLLLEQQAFNLGANQYWKAVNRYREQKSYIAAGAIPPPELSLMKQAIVPLIARIEAQLDRVLNNGSGNQSNIDNPTLVLSLLGAKKAAYITARAAIEAMCRSSTEAVDQVNETSLPSYQRVAKNLGTLCEDEVWFNVFGESAPALFSLMLQQLKNVTTYRHKRTVMYRKMHQLESMASKGDKLSTEERMRLGAILLALFEDATGWVEIKGVWDNKTRTTCQRVIPTEGLLAWLQGEHERCSFLHPQWQPMVCPPRPWTDNSTGGYLTGNHKIIKTNHKPTLDKITPERCPKIFEAVNSIQAVPWRVNEFVLEVQEQFWEVGGCEAGLPRREPLPVPKRPVEADENKELHRKWKREATKIRTQNVHSLSERVNFVRMMKTARACTEYDRVWLPVQLDFRGRFYQIPACCYQGAKHIRALFEFAEGKSVRDQGGADWLAIHGANCFGVDKVSFAERIAWVAAHEEQIWACACDPFECRWWQDADEPWMFLAWCAEWAGYMTDGFEHISHLPVAMDGTCNGLQHWAAMLRDADAGRAVNLLPSDKPQDIYDEVADATVEILHSYIDGSEDADGLSNWQEREEKRRKKCEKDGKEFRPRNFIPPSEWARRWLRFGIDRNLAKRPVMIVPYSGTQYSVGDYIFDAVLKAPARQRKILSATSENDLSKAASRWLAPIMWKAIACRIPSAVKGMAWLKNLARLVASQGKALEWKSPYGLPVFQNYFNRPSIHIDTVLAGGIRVRMAFDDEDVPESELTVRSRSQATGCSPNFVHNLDAACLICTASKAVEAGILNIGVIHDSYATHCCDCSLLARFTREGFVEIHDTPQLETFRDQVRSLLGPEGEGVEIPEPPFIGTLDISRVMESLYFFA